MALRTRKVYDYRGFRVHLRHLSANFFEYLIPVGKDVYERAFSIGYAPRKKSFTKEELEGIDEMMRDVANNFLDTLIYQRSFRGKINKIIFNANKWWKSRVPVGVPTVPGADSGQGTSSKEVGVSI